ncbi:hypothetical protein H5410_036108 [Solanum commersonii]|uniref:Uncharacterized protein n=1 Tax=Solanum commersonii TaxID=4109 RepID=A0A9J5Y6K9_SOLCO|nr:hypothetical protein H5410_036108 [Solanum commersonii]
MDTNESSKIDETMTEANVATLDSLNNNKQAHHKEVIMHGELDFSKRSTEKKLAVEKITKNALMGGKTLNILRVEEDTNNSSHEVIQERMSNGEDSQSTPAAQIEREKALMIFKHQDDEVSQESVQFQGP